MGKTAEEKKNAKKKAAYKLPCVSIRMVKKPPILSHESIDSPQAAVRVLADKLKDFDREMVGIVCLNARLAPICMNIVSIGTLSSSLAHPREILKSIVLANADSVLMFHNHPSGNLDPSKEDIGVTDRLLQICELMDITLQDHVIIGPDGEHFFSFRSNGIFDTLADTHRDVETAKSVADLSGRWK